MMMTTEEELDARHGMRRWYNSLTYRQRRNWLSREGRRVGVSEATIYRAIKSGLLSGVRQDDGSYQIDPAEPERFYAAEKARAARRARGFFIWLFGCVACGIIGGVAAMAALLPSANSEYPLPNWRYPLIENIFWIGFVGGACAFGCVRLWLRER
jgi:hypothetical protein